MKSEPIPTPAFVQVFHLRYTLRPVLSVEIDGDDGICDVNRLRICWAIDRPPAVQIETLWHEILHAIHHHFDLDDPSPEERFTLLGARGHLQVLRDNPWLLPLLCGQ